ncbi:hypothetical protein [Mesorhizobium kowhaii]|uniref:hypothetical protein n=1 Tax=Mesorhizobium kowhaii TaxID=1300272 RepID=UPI0011B80F59|nr:hypothetical protein [Mesorhizobium kowhaii]
MIIVTDMTTALPVVIGAFVLLALIGGAYLFVSWRLQVADDHVQALRSRMRVQLDELRDAMLEDMDARAETLSSANEGALYDYSRQLLVRAVQYFEADGSFQLTFGGV